VIDASLYSEQREEGREKRKRTVSRAHANVKKMKTNIRRKAERKLKARENQNTKLPKKQRS
jgi:vacuolar-type H+-ATPase subunit H